MYSLASLLVSLLGSLVFISTELNGVISLHTLITWCNLIHLIIWLKANYLLPRNRYTHTHTEPQGFMDSIKKLIQCEITLLSFIWTFYHENSHPYDLQSKRLKSSTITMKWSNRCKLFRRVQDKICSSINLSYYYYSVIFSFIIFIVQVTYWYIIFKNHN